MMIYVCILFILSHSFRFLSAPQTNQYSWCQVWVLILHTLQLTRIPNTVDWNQVSHENKPLLLSIILEVSRPRLPNTKHEEVFGPPKTYLPKTPSIQQVFGRLGIPGSLYLFYDNLHGFLARMSSPKRVKTRETSQGQGHREGIPPLQRNGNLKGRWRFKQRVFSNGACLWCEEWYCWWFRNPAWDVQNLVNNGISSISTGVGFQPSTVVWYIYLYLGNCLW